jgi:MFS transporter, NNP family, nitrate/nitrite transporter
MLADRLGAKRVGMGMLAFLFLPLALGSELPPSFEGLLVVGAMLGTAGASFAVALPLASRWFPPERQGLAMGIAAAGNSGTVVTNLVAPRLAASIGWSRTLAAAMIPLALVLVAFTLLAHEAPCREGESPHRDQRPPRSLLPALREPDLWWLCFFYAVTFGGYVGLGSFLPLLLRDQYGLSPITAGYVTAGVTFLGSALRPVGGIVADRIGGTRLLSTLLFVIVVAYALESRQPVAPRMVLLVAVSMSSLGLGNGAVFQIVPRRFASAVGSVTGVVGAFGGVGGFLLPTLLGSTRERTGSFATGFVVLAGVAAVAAVCLRALLVVRGPAVLVELASSKPVDG